MLSLPQNDSGPYTFILRWTVDSVHYFRGLHSNTKDMQDATQSLLKMHINRISVFCIKAIFLSFISVKTGTFLFPMSYFTAQFGWTRPLVVFEKFYFFIFFQHFLQQYRRHRIHSFTNTKHTTTLVAAAAAVKGRGEMLRVLEVASSALAIPLFQTLPSSVIARKNLPFGVAILEPFCSIAVWEQWKKLSFETCRGKTKRFLTKIWACYSNWEEAEMEVKRRGSVGYCCN